MIEALVENYRIFKIKLKQIRYSERGEHIECGGDCLPDSKFRDSVLLWYCTKCKDIYPYSDVEQK